MTKPESISNEMSVAVTGICECCSDIESSADALLKRFPDERPIKGTPHGLRVILRSLDGGNREDDEAIDLVLANHLHRLAASGFGQIHDDGVIVLPGVVPRASGARH